MPEPRFRRRKEDRPQEITEAALAAFAEKGYAATRVDEVAKRAGVSKGLLYLYFKTKEDLFKAVIRSFVVPKIDELTAIIDSSELSSEEFLRGPFLDFVKTKEDLFKAVIRSFVVPRIDELTAIIDSSELSSEEFLRGPFLDFVKTLPGSPISILVRLMISEGPKHPDLLQFYWENVVSRGLDALNVLLERGVETGEFRRCVVHDLPHLFVMPVVFSVIFKLLFEKQCPDTDQLIEVQIDLLIAHMKGEIE